MKRLIKHINEEQGTFSVVEGKKIKRYYLTKSNIKKFMDYLDSGVFIKFKASKKVKKIDGFKYHHVETIYSIERKTHRKLKVIYSIEHLRKELFKVITVFDHYLFIDFEMSMPPYFKKPEFEAEIIQVGYVLTDNHLNIIKKGNYYLNPTRFKDISKRTLNFLKIEEDVFLDAKDYNYFYDDLKDIYRKYHPKCIVWGKNDFLTLKSSYEINNVKPITTRTDFINLLQIIKTYYNLHDDIGLKNAYIKMVEKDYIQNHDAYSDAFAMLEIYQVFLKQMKKDTKKIFR